MDYDNSKVHKVYGELSKIEESFRICKSDLNTRPMFVRKDEHIEAHLMVCFTSLLIIRLLELKLADKSISAERTQRALSSFGCEEISKGILRLNINISNNEYAVKKDENGNQYFSLSFSDKDETIEDLLCIQEAFGSQFSYVNVKQEALNKYLKSIQFAITK